MAERLAGGDAATLPRLSNRSGCPSSLIAQLLWMLLVALLVAWPRTAWAEQREREPNDKKPAATIISLGSETLGSLFDKDEDWFCYDVAYSGTFTVSLRSDTTNVRQQLLVSVLNAEDEELCAMTVQATKGERATEQLKLSPGRVFIRVWGAKRALSKKNYRLRLFLDDVVTVQQNPPSVLYRGRMEGQGWKPEWKKSGATAGAMGTGQLLEAFQAKVSGRLTGGVAYRACMSTDGWAKAWASDGAPSNEVEAGERLEAVRIELTGNIEGSYDVWYRVYVEGEGWTGWASNGQRAGTKGYGCGLEALQVKLVKRGGKAPGSTKNTFRSRA